MVLGCRKCLKQMHFSADVFCSWGAMLLRRPHKLSLPSAHMPPCPPIFNHPVSGCGGKLWKWRLWKYENCGKENCGKENCGKENYGNGEQAQTFTANLDPALDLAQALMLPIVAASLHKASPRTASKPCNTMFPSRLSTRSLHDEWGNRVLLQ